MNYGEKKVTTPEGICELFGELFQKVYVNDAEISPVSLFGIEKVTDVIKRKRGSDDISLTLLRNCADVLSAPLHYLYNLSLSTRTYLDRWKISYPTAIHKSGSRSNVENYRMVVSSSYVND